MLSNHRSRLTKDNSRSLFVPLNERSIWIVDPISDLSLGSGITRRLLIFKHRSILSLRLVHLRFLSDLRYITSILDHTGWVGWRHFFGRFRFIFDVIRRGRSGHYGGYDGRWNGHLLSWRHTHLLQYRIHLHCSRWVIRRSHTHEIEGFDDIRRWCHWDTARERGGHTEENFVSRISGIDGSTTSALTSSIHGDCLHIDIRSLLSDGNRCRRQLINRERTRLRKKWNKESGKRRRRKSEMRWHWRRKEVGEGRRKRMRGHCEWCHERGLSHQWRLCH